MSPLAEIVRFTCDGCYREEWSWEPPVKAYQWLRRLGWTTSPRGHTLCPKCSGVKS